MSAPTESPAAAAGTQKAAVAAEFHLQHPFTSGAGVRIERIELRRGRRADLRASNQYSDNEFEQETFLLARLTGLTMEDLDQLDMQDNAELVRRFRTMLGVGQTRPGDAAAG